VTTSGHLASPLGRHHTFCLRHRHAVPTRCTTGEDSTANVPQTSIATSTHLSRTRVSCRGRCAPTVNRTSPVID
jgi:hypothetical protein